MKKDYLVNLDYKYINKITYQIPKLELISVLAKTKTVVQLSNADMEIEYMKDGGSWDRP